MKKRVLFSACVLAACLGACTNDDFSTENVRGTVESNGEETVVGADLVSHGMTIRINGDEAATRVTDKGAWEVGDQLGLGWFNFEDGTESIVGTQDEATWWNQVIAPSWGVGYGNDNKLYANHIFTGVGASSVEGWETTTDVYQGAYFAYFPYEKLGGIKAKELKVNSTPQTEEFMQDWLNNGLRLSAQDFITGEDVDESNTLTHNFYMRPVVNVLQMEMVPEDPIKDQNVLQGMNITEVVLNAGGSSQTNGVFVKPGAALNLKGIPAVQKVYDDMDGIVDETGTYNELFKAAEDATDGKSFLATGFGLEGTLSTTVLNADYTLAANHDVRAFAFPIPDNAVDYSNGEYPWAAVKVGRLGTDAQNNLSMKYELGQFIVNNVNNSKFIGKLKNSLDKDQTNAAASLTKLLRSGDNGKTWEPLAFTEDKDAAVKLTLKDFYPFTDNIRTVAQWNDLVDVYDALNAVLGEDEVDDPTFTWNPDAYEVFNDEIKTPQKGTITLKTANGKEMTITGKVTWPENLVTSKNVNAAIVVATGAELTVGETNESVEAKDRVSIQADIENNGTIYAGKNATIGADDNQNLDNTLDGTNRVIVTYGAYVYPSVEGVIAYEVNKAEEEDITKIELLVRTNDNANYANVNTLIVKSGVTLDLNAKGETISGNIDNPYEDPETPIQYAMPNLSDVDIELEGGSVVYTDGAYKNVKNVYNVSGDGIICDIEPLENIVVKGGSLTINSDPVLNVPLKALRMADGKSIEVKSGCELNVNTNVYVTYLINRTRGTITINDNNFIEIPSVDNFTNDSGSTLTGKLQYTAPPAEEYTAEEQAVIEAFEAYKESSDAPTSLADMVAKLNDKDDILDHKNDWDSSKLYFALSDWMAVTVGMRLNATGTPTKLTETMFVNFQNLSGYTFF